MGCDSRGPVREAPQVVPRLLRASGGGHAVIGFRGVVPGSGISTPRRGAQVWPFGGAFATDMRKLRPSQWSS